MSAAFDSMYLLRHRTDTMKMQIEILTKKVIVYILYTTEQV